MTTPPKESNDQDFTSILYLDGVSVSFDGFKALNNLSFVIEPGEMRAIIGPNGIGKSTLLNVVLQKLEAKAGLVTINGKVDARNCIALYYIHSLANRRAL